MATISCPVCGKLMLERTVKKPGKNFGKTFLGCSGFPKCNNMIWNIPREEKVIEYIAAPSNVTGTPQQENFWDAVRTKAQHIILDAKAGTGKTFSIVHAYSFIPATMRVMFAAFNTHIIDELTARLPQGSIVKTMNSFGHGQVKAWNRALRFNKNKLDDMIESAIPLDTMAEDDERNHVLFMRESVEKLVNFARYRMVDVSSANLYDSFDLIAADYDIALNDSTNEIYSHAKNILKLCGDLKSLMRYGFDFVDQLWLIWRFNIKIEQFDLLFGDEIQDWNPIQWYVAYKAISDHGRFIGVGDVNQSIYGFAGADIDSIPNIITDLQNTKRGVIVLPLTFTRRCPVTHVTLAQRIVPELEAMPEAKEGSVTVATMDTATAHMTTGNMVICRRNAPLISLAYKLIKEGKIVVVKGRDIGKGMQGLITKLKAESILDLIEKAEAYRQKELAKLALKAKANENKIQSLNDRIDTLIALTEGKDTIDQLRRYIQELFDDSNRKDAITLSSVHKAKGLESDVVFVIDYAKIQLKLKNPKLQQQECHLEYIALTRSKDTLWLID